MKHDGIRLRLLQAALLPAVLVAAVLATVLIGRQLASIDAAVETRARAQARQLADAAGYGIFVDNHARLAGLARAMNEANADIQSVTVLDSHGDMLVRSGNSVLTQWPAIEDVEQRFDVPRRMVVTAPIRRAQLAVDAIHGAGVTAATPLPTAPPARVDGLVVLEISPEAVERERAVAIIAGVVITLFGMLLGGALALRIARGIVRPVVRMSEVVGRIAAGDLAARVRPDPAGAVGQLESGINEMAARIEHSQEELREQVAAATTELRVRKEEAEQANAAKSRFLAAASHDLRQPMHALGLFVSRLATLPLDPEARGLVRYVESSVDTLQELLDTLLDISRLDAGLVQPRLAEIDVTDLFVRLELDHAESANRKGLTLRRHGGGGLRVHSDPVLLDRILMNFIANAIHHTQRGGILLACRRRGEHARIEVWDTGVGIAPEWQRTIFDEYVQLANPERDRDKGLGLGLAICERLATLLKLPLGLRSLPGRGSVFWIEVPLATPLAGATSDENAATKNVASDEIGQPMRGVVLVVDDDQLVRESTRQLLASWGCLPIVAASLPEAMAECAEQQRVPAVAICDYRLRGHESGINAARVLRMRYGDLPVLMLSADLGDELKQEAARHKLTLLSKPLRPARLRALLLHLLPPSQQQMPT